MVRYVAFLRGINVGGRVVVKETLQQTFTSLGFQNVSTFKQSGNVIFEATEQTEAAKAKIEAALKAALGYEVPVFIRTVAQLKSIIALDIFKGQSSVGASFLVTFLPSITAAFPMPLPVTIPKSTAEIIAAVGSEVYSVTHGDGEGALPNPFVESKLKVKGTTRNLNVLAAIAEKYG
jgi:uncharacterized protein (DUF1697 family)